MKEITIKSMANAVTLLFVLYIIGHLLWHADLISKKDLWHPTFLLIIPTIFVLVVGIGIAVWRRLFLGVVIGIAAGVALLMLATAIAGIISLAFPYTIILNIALLNTIAIITYASAWVSGWLDRKAFSNEVGDMYIGQGGRSVD